MIDTPTMHCINYALAPGATRGGCRSALVKFRPVAGNRPHPLTRSLWTLLRGSGTRCAGGKTWDLRAFFIGLSLNLPTVRVVFTDWARKLNDGR